MTDTDRPAFLQCVARLAVALREPEPDVMQIRTTSRRCRISKSNLSRRPPIGG